MSAATAETHRKRAQLQALLELVSPRTGIVKSLELHVKSVNEPPLPLIYDARLSHFDFRKADAIERGSSGKGMTEEDAMLGAVGEAIERYCASHTPLKQMRRARARFYDGSRPGRFRLRCMGFGFLERAGHGRIPNQPAEEPVKETKVLARGIMTRGERRAPR